MRSPLYPDPLADEGEHRFTYSVFPHAGDWTEAGVAAEAFALNSPLIAVPAGPDTADGPGSCGSKARSSDWARSSWPMDGDGLVLRVYEPNGARGPVTLRFADPVKAVERVNLLEEPSMADASSLIDGGADGPVRRAAVRSDLASDPEVAP